MRPGLYRVIVAAIVAALACTPVTAAENDTTRQRMHDIYDAISYLLPLAFDGDRFTDPRLRDEVLERLQGLASAADELERHASGRGRGFESLARSLATVARELPLHYRNARAGDARYFLSELTQHCTGCHSRLPAAKDFDIAGGLLERIEPQELGSSEQARLAVALRRFDDALETWEAMFDDPSVSPVALDVDGDIVDYLTVSLRVERDARRARDALSKLLVRADTPHYLARHLRTWLDAIDALEAALDGPASLQRARQIATAAAGLSPFPAGRERLVHDIVASALLHRLIADPDAHPAAELSEAYYLLGVMEARSIDSSWNLPQLEFHLEAAIRAEPSGRYADEAYALLEEYLLLGYGPGAPPEITERLDELRSLMRAQ